MRTPSLKKLWRCRLYKKASSALKRPRGEVRPNRPSGWSPNMILMFVARSVVEAFLPYLWRNFGAWQLQWRHWRTSGLRKRLVTSDYAYKLSNACVQSLESEIEIWSRLRHDHIVPFYGASTLTHPPYIVSRYMRNGNLIRYLARKPNTDHTKLVCPNDHGGCLNH